ncbi:helix-turn-helix transcriptional regulator [Pseudochelatococcus sp. B33]
MMLFLNGSHVHTLLDVGTHRHAMACTFVLDMHVHDMHIPTMSTLATLLSERGLTDADLAGRVGCDRSMISKIRSGKAIPSLRLALAISRETGLPIDQIVPSIASPSDALPGQTGEGS